MRFCHFVAFALAALLLGASLTNGQAEDEKDPIVNYAALERPYRMQKVNLVWEKARVKLSDTKLKLLFYELKLLDKEEVALKKLKAEFGDKDGLREADVRKKFNSILNHYGLGGKQAEDTKDATSTNLKKDNMRVFKDKKLDRLWHKIKMTDMQDEELVLLKREFQHYQEKVDEYHRLMEISGKDPLDQNRRRNTVDDLDEFDDMFGDDTDERQKHVNALEGDDMKRELKRSYAKLKRMATDPGSSSSENNSFEEPKVNGLWKLAQEADFSQEELNSLRIELKHYQHRVQKLHQMKAEISLMDERGSSAADMESEAEGFEFRKRMDKKMKQHAESVKESHIELERKIVARHTEL